MPFTNSYSEVTVEEDEVKISDCSHDTADTNANIDEDTTETIDNEINDNNVENELLHSQASDSAENTFIDLTQARAKVRDFTVALIL